MIINKKLIFTLLPLFALVSCGGGGGGDTPAKKTYTVTFDSDGGTKISSQTVKSGEKITKPEDPTKTSTAQYTFTFKEWQLDGGAFDFDNTPINKDITLKAKWINIVNKYTVTWKNGINTLEVDENVPYGTMPSYDSDIPSKSPTQEFTYTFDGWTPNVTPVTGNITYNAKFNEIKNKYTVTFDSDGGSSIDPITVDYGTYITKPNNPTKQSSEEYHYIFDKWQLNGADFDFDNTAITGNITLKAKWTSVERVQRTVTFKNGDETYDTQIIKDGNYATKPAVDPTKTSTAQYTFTFKEWQLDGGAFDFDNTPITSDITLNASYSSTIREYQIRFLSEDGLIEYQKSNVKYGETPEYSGETPTKESTQQYSYTFNGWDSTITTVTGNKDYKATFTQTLNKYTVTFNSDGGSKVDSITVDYGSYISAPTNPTKENDDEYNYTFDKWQLNGEDFDFDNTPITGNITLKAKWTGTYWWNDETYLTKLVNDAATGVIRGVRVNNVLHRVRLIGFNHDNLADGSGKARMTWEFANVISNSSGTPKKITFNNSYVGDTGDYINSSMRYSLDGGGDAGSTSWEDESTNTVISLMPESLVSKMKTVTKYVYKRWVDGQVKMEEKPYDTKLFQLATKEIGYSSSTAESSNVSTYSYYSSATQKTDEKRMKASTNGTAREYWLRSPEAIDSSSWTAMWEVRSGGGLYSYYPVAGGLNYRSISPVFCL